MHGNSMNTSVKNNLKLLRKRDKLKFRFVGKGKASGKTEYDFPKATPKQLRHIKKRLQIELQAWWLKAILLTLLIVIGIVVLIIYLIENVI